MLGRLEDSRLRYFQQRDDLLAAYAGKTFKKIVNRISGFQMVEEAFDRNARSAKNGSTAENLWV